MQVLMWMVGCGPPEVDFSVPVPILRGAKLSWTTHEELVAKEAKQAAAELRSPRSVSDEWVATFSVITPRPRGPGSYLVVIRDAAGEEIVRQWGRNGFMGDNVAGNWSVYMSAYSSTEGTWPLDVYLVDPSEPSREHWTVSRDEQGIVTVK